MNRHELKRHEPSFVALLALALIVPLMLPLAAPPAALAASGAPSQPAPAAPPPQTPEQIARDHYNNGLRMRDRAWKLEEKAAKAAEEGNEAKEEKLLGKVDKQFEAAAREFQRAVSNDRQLFQAWSSLGYALRRLGEYQESLSAYNRALDIEPGYTEAIEYRAEAYLGLGRVEEAKEAYMVLFNHDRERADELLAAMEQWVEERRQDPGQVDARKVEELAGWVEQRSQVSTQTSALYTADGVGASGTAW